MVVPHCFGFQRERLVSRVQRRRFLNSRVATLRSLSTSSDRPFIMRTFQSERSWTSLSSSPNSKFEIESRFPASSATVLIPIRFFSTSAAPVFLACNSLSNQFFAYLMSMRLGSRKHRFCMHSISPTILTTVVAKRFLGPWLFFNFGSRHRELKSGR